MPNVRTSIAALFAIVSLGGSVTLAQVTGNNREELTVQIGSIFEIQAAAPASASANWVLTQGGEFVESGREMVFRTRFSREGDYNLAAQVTVDGNTTERLFVLNVRARRPEDAIVADGPGGIVGFTPALQNNNLAISPATQVVTVTPVRNDVNVLALDLDTEADSNGDGNPANDEDTRNTLFRSEGNPLRIWFTSGKSRTIRFGALLTNGDSVFENISVGAAGNTRPTRPPQDQQPQEPTSTIQSNTDMKVLVLKSDNGEVQYALRLPAEQDEPVLLLWDFGDGSQSMLDRPIHTYAESGRYDVSVQVRSLRSGEVLSTVQDSIMVNRLKDEPEPGTPTDDKPKDDDKEGGSILGLIFKLLFSLIGFAAIGALIMFIVGKVKNKGFSLEKTMEKAEKTMVKTPSEDTANEPPPMEIAAEEVAEPPQEPEAPKEPEPEPEPEPAPEPQPTPEPAPAPEPDQPTATPPEWLQPNPEPTEPPPPPEPPTPAPAPAPEPTVEKAPNVSHEPMQPSTKELEADAENAPDWLQSGIQKAEQEGQTPDAPPPPNLSETPAPPTEASTDANTDDSAEAEAAKREKKRRKRQRYRENLKKRKQETTPETAQPEEAQPTDAGNNEPVAFIKAEDIEPMEAPQEQPPEPPTESPEDDQKPA